MSLTLLTTYGWLGAFVTLWIGLCVGSFLNVVIYRYPIMLQRAWNEQAKEILRETQSRDAQDEPSEDPQLQASELETFNLSIPRSHCPGCGEMIKWWQNIPLLSWLMLGGSCAACKTKISIRYPLVELLTGLATVVVVMTFGFTWFALLACICTWLLVAALGIDFDTQLLPDQLTYPILWLGLIANGFFSGLVTLQDAVLGAVAGYLFLWGTYWVFKLLTGKEGMGYGDFKLLAGLGAWVGWQSLPSIVLLSAVLGLIYAFVQMGILRNQDRSEAIAFGPYLAIAGWIALIFFEQMLVLFAF